MSDLPTLKSIHDTLGGLLGRDVRTVVTDDMPEDAATGGVLARYVDDRGHLRAVAVWDLPAAANVGAAVGLLPRGAAEAALEDRLLSTNLVENLSEVSNVLASTFNVPGNPHLRLAGTVVPVSGAPADAQMLARGAWQRLDFDVEVDGYGAGRVAVCMAA
jgi:hypothetical protein